MSTSARQLEEPCPDSSAADTPTSAPGEPVRGILIKYQRALGLIEKLAVALLDSVQPDAEPMSPEQARERRRTIAEAMTMVAAETPHGERLWRELAIDRRVAHADAPLPVAVRADRRRRLPRGKQV